MIDNNKSNVVQFDVSVNRLLNIAYKKIDKSEYLDAVPILKKALKEDPENVDVLLELATLYSKMNILDVSNKYAYKALTLEHNETSLFVMGNNFLKQHKYDKGIIYFKRLLDMYPDGDYADYVSAVAERIESKGAVGRDFKLLKLTHKGKKYIEKEQYSKAIRLFSLVSMVVPDQLFIKNNLAMAYFYDGKPEKAIKICKEILSKRKYDVYANCNLTMFYYKQKNKYEFNKHKAKLGRIKPSTQEEYVKLISTYCEMKCHEDVIRVVRQAAMIYFFDLTYLFFLAAANYNLGNVNKALSVYHDILKVDEDNYIAHYYIKSINSLMKPKKIDYYNQLPVVAIIDSVKRLRVLAEMSADELKETWNKDDRLVVIWGTRYKDEGIKRMCFNILGTLANDESEMDLRNALFSVSTSDELKKDILAALGIMNAKQPYAAYFAGDILDVKVSVATIEGAKELKRPQKAMEIFQNSVAEDFDDNLLKECIDMYVMILNKGLDKGFHSLNALCAVIEMSVREMYKLSYSKKELVTRYHTTADTVENYGNRIAELLLDGQLKALKEKRDMDFENED